MKYIRDKEGIKLFGFRIKALRLERGWSQNELALRCGFLDTQIARIERGEVNTSLSVAFLIARVLEISLSDLFNFELPPFNDTRELK